MLVLKLVKQLQLATEKSVRYVRAMFFYPFLIATYVIAHSQMLYTLKKSIASSTSAKKNQGKKKFPHKATKQMEIVRTSS